MHYFNLKSAESCVKMWVLNLNSGILFMIFDSSLGTAFSPWLTPVWISFDCSTQGRGDSGQCRGDYHSLWHWNRGNGGADKLHLPSGSDNCSGSPALGHHAFILSELRALFAHHLPFTDGLSWYLYLPCFVLPCFVVLLALLLPARWISAFI